MSCYIILSVWELIMFEKPLKKKKLYLYKNDRIFIRTLLGDVYILLNV